MRQNVACQVFHASNRYTSLRPVLMIWQGMRMKNDTNVRNSIRQDLFLLVAVSRVPPTRRRRRPHASHALRFHASEAITDVGPIAQQVINRGTQGTYSGPEFLATRFSWLHHCLPSKRSRPVCSSSRW